MRHAAGRRGGQEDGEGQHCLSCWAAEFGTKCAMCHKPIEGKAVKVGRGKAAKCYHPKCKPTSKSAGMGGGGMAGLYAGLE
eukprot:COSAG04_NODE_301_length_17421_cov_23.392045_16_plen_81_part_00